ncbi:mechanosensitive ion channel domain-containing protein [Novipirellula artificiosorum]|uniref:Putative MscS family protein.1 n=1 Tax=Novipirellula artificiosorum TaxID=2528016 RepID=A0A5C6DKG9_9BACT|nr:mechanosensitive ion channel domain-containing protein [Novipirellula artificiosorum]TWU37258.1 putative MscS family protein.1 precursor [Novipirellula artificiosorum]
MEFILHCFRSIRIGWPSIRHRLCFRELSRSAFFVLTLWVGVAGVAQTDSPLQLSGPSQTETVNQPSGRAESPAPESVSPVSSAAPAAESTPAAAESTPAAAESTPAVAEFVVPTVLPRLTKADLETRIQQVTASVDLDDASKTQITDQLKKALTRLEEAKQSTQRIEQLERQATMAPEEINAAQADLAKLSAKSAEEATEHSKLPLDELRNHHRQAIADLATLDQQLKTLTEEVDRWTKRIADLPTLTAAARSSLAEAEKQLAEIPAAETEDALANARKSLVQARVSQLQQELKLYDTESRVAEDAQRLLSIQRDATGRKQLLKQKQVEGLQAALAKAEKAAAEQQADLARLAAAVMDEPIKGEAELNSLLAEQKTQMLDSLEQDRIKIIERREDYLAKEALYAETRKQAEAAQFSEQIGLVLRTQKHELPSTSKYHQNSIDRRETVSDLTVDILKWEKERRNLLDLDAAVDAALKKAPLQVTEKNRENVESQLREILNDRLNLYRELTEIARKRLNRLMNLESEEVNLAELIDKQAAFVSEHVLWVPSTTPMSLSLAGEAVELLLELANPTTLRRATDTLRKDVVEKPVASIAVWLLLGWLVVSRGRIKRELSRLGNEASRPNATQFAPTANAVMMTALIASPAALLFLWIGWRLTKGSPIGANPYYFGQAFFIGGVCLYGVDFVRHVFRSDGLAEDHFDWDLAANHVLRRGLVWSARVIVPCSVLVVYTELLADELTIASLGRLAFAIAMVTAAGVLWTWVGPKSAIMVRIGSTSQSWLARLGVSLVPLLSLVPLVLLMGSLAGYHYAAVQLSWRFAVSTAIVALLIFGRALLFRWLLITYRRVAIARAKERRAALAHARESTAEMPSDAAEMIESAGHVQLSDLNRQAQSFLRFIPIVLGAFGLYLTWSEFVPALGVINRFELWENVLQSSQSDSGPVYVTLGDLILAIVSAVLTVVATRNIPGLLDITLLQRLPLDAGARYAASALTRYLMIVVGSIATFHYLGVSWGSVQWLVAAMSVGLGFGLQEIFANFVSGIILLFERPARVGDTVTIGEVTGTVTRIRTRATTILDWDNKELIVPNREFVTGNLVNWTLSNPSLRLTTTVGVAYGSNTRLTTRLLYEVAAANPLVLDDPEPVVVFSSFAESTLDFELRVFTNGLTNFRRLRHELHLAIDDLFREHGIEIAFPQRDLHVRSMDGLDIAKLRHEEAVESRL